MQTAEEAEFSRFSSRFAVNYWEDIVTHDEDEVTPISLEDRLAQIKVQTCQVPENYGTPATYRLRMEDEYFDWWEFCFQPQGDGWKLVSARSGAPGAPAGRETTDWLDEVYGPHFAELLDRVLQKSLDHNDVT